MSSICIHSKIIGELQKGTNNRIVIAIKETNRLKEEIERNDEEHKDQETRWKWCLG